MEEFLKIKAEELDYLIEEREKIERKSKKSKKDSEDLIAISDLIKELSEQLINNSDNKISNNNIKSTSKEIYDWETEKNYLDNKERKSRYDKADIRDINDILKELSSKLKEISNRKGIEEYKKDLRNSQNNLKNYENQLVSLELLKNKIDESIYLKVRKEIENLTAKEHKNIEYNEKIINAYNLLKINQHKLRFIEQTDFESNSREKSNEIIEINNIIKNCKKILPENLQIDAINQAKIDVNSELNKEQVSIKSFRKNEPNVKFATFNNNLKEVIDEDDYFDEEDKEEDFDPRFNIKKQKTVIDDPIKLLNEKPLEELLKLRDAYQGDIQFYKEKSDLKDPTLKSYVENLEQKLDEVQKIIDKKKLDNMSNTLMGAIYNAYDHIKQSPKANISSTPAEENLEENVIEEDTLKNKDKLKPKENIEVENSMTSVENNIPEKELTTTVEDSLNDFNSKKDNDIELENVDLNDEKSNEEKDSKKKFKIKNVRKSIKNIARKTIIKVSSLAVTLVLVIAGAHSCSVDKKDTKQYNEIVDQIDNENGITTYKSATTGENTYEASSLEQETSEKTTDSYSQIENQNYTEPDSEKEIQVSGVDIEPVTETDFETEGPISQYTNQYDIVNDDNENNNLDDGVIYLNDNNEIYPSEYNNDTSIHIGSEVTVDGNIHDDEYDAYYNENNQTSYYGTDAKRVVIGTGIVNDNGMNVIYAYSPDANQKIDELLNEGGEMVSILTANKEKYLQDYNGSTTLTPEQIKASAEGWYNINDVSMNNGKGMSR